MHDDSEDTTGIVDLFAAEVADQGQATVIAGRYEIIERIGEGGMGQILHVRHRRLDKSFALKLMRAELSVDDAARAEFRREAELVSALAHPHIVSTVDFGDDPDWGLFLVMEFLEGKTLREHIEKGPRLSVIDACTVIAQLADAIDHSHGHYIVHGDLKPENVLCIESEEEDGAPFSVKLLDFGTARIATGVSGSDSTITGTPAFMAPERITGDPPAPSHDIYALGVLMYELLTGTVPFSGSNANEVLHAHLAATPDGVSVRRGEPVDMRVEAIVEKAMAKATDDRYATARDFADALRQCIADLDPSSSTTKSQLHADHDRAVAAAADAFFELGLPACGLSVTGTIVVASARFARLWGLENPSELAGINILRTKLSEVHPGLRQDVRRAAMDGAIVRRRLLIKRDNKEYPLRLLITPSEGKCGSCMVVLYPIAKAK